MINANELRRGNFLKFLPEVKNVLLPVLEVAEVLEIRTNEIVFKNHPDVDVALPLKLVAPIPLTEEWLLKFGFGSAGFFNGNKVFTNNHSRILMTPDNAFIFEMKMDRMYSVNFVHQLQNLYFALTEEELKINVPSPAPQ